MENPSFPKRDPATAEFWDLRYEAGFQPWDARGVPSQLRACVASRTPRSVLVPGCGSAWDVRLFAESGWNVLGLDFSAEAVAAARPVLQRFAGCVRQADFFFAPIAEAPFDVVYERAFLCALFGDAFERVEDVPVPDSLEVFRGRERWQLWRRR